MNKFMDNDSEYTMQNHNRPFDRAQGRRSIRLKNYDYSSPGAYFVTICINDRQCLLGKIVNRKTKLNKTGEIIYDEWLKTSIIRMNVKLDEFIIMPNHLHGIIIITNGNGLVVGANRRFVPTRIAQNNKMKPNTLCSIIAQFKSVATKRIRQNGFPNFQWQRNYYEHIIRNESELNRIRKYIQNNPQQWEIDQENSKLKEIKHA